MKPTKYVLLLERGCIILRFYSDDPQLIKGYCNVECVPFVTGRSLDGFRKSGAKHAKRFGVPFEDQTNA